MSDSLYVYTADLVAQQNKKPTIPPTNPPNNVINQISIYTSQKYFILFHNL